MPPRPILRLALVGVAILLVILAVIALGRGKSPSNSGTPAADSPTPAADSGTPAGSPGAGVGGTRVGDGTSLAPSLPPDSSADSLPDDGHAAIFARLRAEPPTRDPVDLAVRMGRAKPPVRRTREGPPQTYAVGNVLSFWIHDIDAEKYFEVKARLEVITQNAYFWVQEGQSFQRNLLTDGAHAFGDLVMPSVRGVFGTEWSPGVDNDPRVHVLHHEPVSGVAGYYSSTDEYTTPVEPRSNEREMFYINLGVFTPGSYDYLALLSHEYQHMIHWHHDPDEDVWANEGLSELAPVVSGYQAQTGRAYLREPDTALLEWAAEPQANAQHYAGAFLFFAYLRARYGDAAIRAFVAAPPNGPNGVEAALATIGHPASFDATFLDFAVANVVHGSTPRSRRTVDGGYPRPATVASSAADAEGNGPDPESAASATAYPKPGERHEPAPELGSGRRFDYGRLDVKAAAMENLEASGISDTVNPYGVDYYEVTPLAKNGRLDLRFAGDPSVGLLEPKATRRGQVWWSGRGENMDGRLTRRFDLTGVASAEFRFKAWYDLETNWDYAYLLASTDDGHTWQRLSTDRTTDANPNGNSYGEALTGSSDGWVEQSIDLAPYAGKPVLLRFEVLTDDAVSLGGLALDDLQLDAVGFADDAETAQSDGLWQAEGWRRLDPTLPEHWGVQVILQRGVIGTLSSVASVPSVGRLGATSGSDPSEGVRVVRIPVAADGTADIRVDDVPGDAVLTLAISSLTPGTRHPAGYRVQVGEAGAAGATGTAGATRTP